MRAPVEKTRALVAAAVATWAWAGVALTASTGCGFDRPAPYAGVRVADVAPFEDLGPLTFCDGAQRVGVPASPTAGFCVDDTALTACAVDADCRDRERCTCAGCQVAFCDSGDECRADQVCTFADSRCDRPCAADTDCAAGELCQPGAGVCRGRCAATADCQGGEVCQRGACVALTADLGGPCGSDADCSDHPRCAVQRVAGDLREPSPLVGSDGRIVLYIERAGAGGSSVWRAVSSPIASTGDATAESQTRFRFDPASPVISPDASDGGRAGAPSVLATPTGYLAAYANARGQLRRAESSDGRTFSVDDAVLLSASAGWDAAGLDAPSLALALASPGAVAPGAGYLLYYNDLAGNGIGLAHSDDGRAFTARPSPVLDPAAVTNPTLWRDLDRLESPFAEATMSADGAAYLRIYFSARGRESGDAQEFGMSVPESPNDSIGEASTVDGTTLVPWPFDPAFDRVEQFLDHLSERSPAVLSVGDGVRLLFYRAAAADGSSPANLGVARNPVPPS